MVWDANQLIEITFNFLHVGHTGFSVDQLFSILTAQFKNNEIKTLEDLHTLIINSAIIPKPTVESLDYIFDWKNSIASQMTELGLKIILDKNEI